MSTNFTILYPVFALAFWTFIVLNVLGISRIRAGVKGHVLPADFRLGESERVPENIRLANRNYMNLLFYAICIIIYVTGTTTGVLVALAWLFAGLRFVHSAIHLTSNQVMHRLYAFSASNTTLLVIWVLAAVAVAQKSGA